MCSRLWRLGHSIGVWRERGDVIDAWPEGDSSSALGARKSKWNLLLCRLTMRGCRGCREPWSRAPLCLLSLAACGGKSNHHPRTRPRPARHRRERLSGARPSTPWRSCRCSRRRIPTGGVVITDWYTVSKNRTSGSRPRSSSTSRLQLDGLNGATVFKQVSDGNGGRRCADRRPDLDRHRERHPHGPGSSPVEPPS